MNTVKSKVDDFLIKYNMHYSSIDISYYCESFIDEMKKGLDGSKSSLEMLQTYISADEEIPLEESVIVMDAGGTNFRVAVVRFDKSGRQHIEDLQTYPMPGSKVEIDREEFFKTIVEYLKPVIDKSDSIGFCFSYPTQILPSRDGKLIAFNKEVRVTGMEGQQIGANLLTALQKNGITQKKRIVMLNDTVATLLAGKYVYPDRNFGSYIGLILGTGTNTCYIEKNNNIKKDLLRRDMCDSSLINIESGGYDKIPQGEIDIIFDNSTNNPGDHIFEKMIGGAYQGGLILEILRKATKEKLFSKQFENKLSKVTILTSKQVNDFCYYPFFGNVLANCVGTKNGENESNDRLVLYTIIDAVMERVAKLVAVNLSAVIIKTGKGTNPCTPICIAAEGSTFYKHKLLKTKIEYYVKEHLNNRVGIYCEFVKSENATLIGSAIAVLIN